MDYYLKNRTLDELKQIAKLADDKIDKLNKIYAKNGKLNPKEDLEGVLYGYCQDRLNEFAWRIEYL